MYSSDFSWAPLQARLHLSFDAAWLSLLKLFGLYLLVLGLHLLLPSEKITAIASIGRAFIPVLKKRDSTQVTLLENQRAVVCRLNGVWVMIALTFLVYLFPWPLDFLYHEFWICAMSSILFSVLIGLGLFFKSRNHEMNNDVYHIRPTIISPSTSSSFSSASSSSSSSTSTSSSTSRHSKTILREEEELNKRRSLSREGSPDSTTITGNEPYFNHLKRVSCWELFLNGAPSSLNSGSPSAKKTEHTLLDWQEIVEFHMYFRLVGTAMLWLLLLSGLRAQLVFYNIVSWPMLAYQVCFFWFLLDYVLHEHVHMYSPEVFTGQIGFRTVWESLFFYPFFYSSGMWGIIKATEEQLVQQNYPPTGFCVCLGLFFFGWLLYRASINQQYLFKVQPSKSFMGYFQPKTFMLGGDSRRVLASGFWSLSRHIDLFGKLIMIAAVSLPAFATTDLSHWWWVVVFILFSSLCMILKTKEEEVELRHRYGIGWERYCEAVSSFVVPYVF